MANWRWRKEINFYMWRLRLQGSRRLVGTITSEKSVCFSFFWDTMATVWKRVRGVTINEIGACRYMFQFYSESDMKRVLDEGPWTFDQNLIVLAKLKQGDLPLKVPLNRADFWLQVHHDVPMGYFSVKNAIKIWNFVGSFIKVDEYNFSLEWNPYMRLRVSIDLNMPLKRKLFLQSNERENFCVKFRYEKLSSLCFACGIIGQSCRKVLPALSRWQWQEWRVFVWTRAESF
ncbi:unnamed protein product [Cuscuta epithymum]|uniref:DUF4283 domain-containing protein n=1 Tax=Cuscuta epithymum TaxID=186058 RepID=A0AAV0DYP6_9ASTE|nr:unnamed protein product [Cuscuta epithymum]